ncbi:UNKNOWN [Stylonychia lemnae]|uniref:Uncharacterized protein n=1 Tax=Stylonychia lemnae TaxID=5949 RepID=A0A078AVT1_STYLE|nr:UNKNOWN [Stylonychia lemnae]|eukprot:CDW86289.1 UNKNOWN [Stylonychia lemnae]
MNTSEYMLDNGLNPQNLTIVIIQDNASNYSSAPAMDKRKKLMSSRPTVKAAAICEILKYFCNLPNFLFHISMTLLLMFRINALEEDDPSAARLLYGKVSFIASFVILGYNAVIYFTDCFLDDTSVDTIIKWLMQIVILGGIGISGYYAFQCYTIFSTDSTNKEKIMDIALAGIFNVSQLFYLITFWIFLCN